MAGCPVDLVDACPGSDAPECADCVFLSARPSKWVRFVVTGIPQPKQRPRQGRSRNGVRVFYTPPETRNYETLVGYVARSVMAGREPSSGLLFARLCFFLPVPNRVTAKEREKAATGVLWASGKPDLDNLVKAVLDGCNGIVFKDDRQVVRLSAEKRYVTDLPRVEAVFGEVG